MQTYERQAHGRHRMPIHFRAVTGRKREVPGPVQRLPTRGQTVLCPRTSRPRGTHGKHHSPDGPLHPTRSRPALARPHQAARRLF